MKTPKHLQASTAATQRIFEDMQDVSNQGVSFSWSTFPDFCSGMVGVSLFLGYARQPKNFEELKEEAIAHSRKMAEELVEANRATLKQRCSDAEQAQKKAAASLPRGTKLH